MIKTGRIKSCNYARGLLKQTKSFSENAIMSHQMVYFLWRIYPRVVHPESSLMMRFCSTISYRGLKVLHTTKAENDRKTSSFWQSFCFISYQKCWLHTQYWTVLFICKIWIENHSSNTQSWRSFSHKTLTACGLLLKSLVCLTLR